MQVLQRVFKKGCLSKLTISVCRRLRCRPGPLSHTVMQSCGEMTSAKVTNGCWSCCRRMVIVRAFDRAMMSHCWISGEELLRFSSMPIVFEHSSPVSPVQDVEIAVALVKRLQHHSCIPYCSENPPEMEFCAKYYPLLPSLYPHWALRPKLENDQTLLKLVQEVWLGLKRLFQKIRDRNMPARILLGLSCACFVTLHLMASRFLWMEAVSTGEVWSCRTLLGWQAI